MMTFAIFALAVMMFTVGVGGVIVMVLRRKAPPIAKPPSRPVARRPSRPNIKPMPRASQPERPRPLERIPYDQLGPVGVPEVDLSHADPYLNWLIASGGVCDGKRFHIGRREVTIGRDPENAFQIADTELSRIHCRLVPHDESLVLEDLDSANGITIGGEMIQSAVLRDGDSFTIGEITFQFHRLANFDGGPAAAKTQDAPWVRMATVHRHLAEPLDSGEEDELTEAFNPPDEPTSRDMAASDWDDEADTGDMTNPTLPQRPQGGGGDMVFKLGPARRPQLSGDEDLDDADDATLLGLPFSESDEGRAEEITNLSDPPVDPLVAKLSEPAQRMAAALSLLNRGHSDDVVHVVRAAGAMTAGEQSVLMSNLTARGTTIEAPLIEALAIDDPNSVYLAACPLAAMRSANAAPHLVALLTTPKRVSSATMLAHSMATYGEAIVPPLATALCEAKGLSNDHPLITLLHNIAGIAGPDVYGKIQETAPHVAAFLPR